ncbi:MAG: AAA domain-containing protein [Thermoplasmatota archaeon]
MAVSRYCPHGNLRATCALCRADALTEAEARAAANRARGESGRMASVQGAEVPYPWQREALEAWSQGGRAGWASLSLGLPVGDLPYAVMAEVVNHNPSVNVLFAAAGGEAEGVRQELSERFHLTPTSLVDHHFLEPKEDGTLVVADLEELATIDLPRWGRFASTGLLIILDADGVTQQVGQMILDTPFRYRFAVSRMPSAIDLVATRPWARAFGPLLYRYTEEQARDVGVLPRIRYRLHVEMLRPEPRHTEMHGPQGPWEPIDIPTRMAAAQAGQFVRGRARDVAIRRARETPGLVVVHDGVAVPGAAATLRLADLPDRQEPAPSGWVFAPPNADAKAILRLATVAFKSLGHPGAVEDAVVLPVPLDLAGVPPWSDKWRTSAGQIDRVVAGLLLAEQPGEAMSVEDLEALVGVALALRGLAADDLHKLTPVVTEAAAAAHAAHSVPPDRVRQAARAFGGLAASLLVAASAGPLQLLRLAHPRFTPVQPDLPHPSLYDARRHAWRGRAFLALAQAAARGDLVTAWGRYPELRFVFPSSSLLEAATSYCAAHRLKGPLDDAKLAPIPDKTRIADGNRRAAAEVLNVWNGALGLAEEHEREFLADMHARQPERERRREGVALPNLELREGSGDSMTFEATEGRLPITNIAPGSEVALVEAGQRAELARGLVSKISSRRVVIEFPAGAPRHLPRHVTVNLVFDAKVFEAYHTAVLGAQRALSATTPVDDGPDGLLRAALLGETDPPASLHQEIVESELTPSQREAIASVLSGGRVRLIHGPPGTGKTHTLVYLAMALARAGHSVLCTADSNAAVDNLVVGLRRHGALVVRVGHAPNIRDEAAEPARIDPIDAPLFVRWAAEQGIVVCTTNYGAFRYIDAKGGLTPFIFDYVIHDEAGQSTAPSSLAAVLRGRRLVLAGDPRQLPPTVVSLDAKEAGLDVTLFERIEELTGQSRTRMLTTQFRMRPAILAFSNARYYGGRVETDPAAAAQEGLPDLPAASFQHVTGRENERLRSGSISNDYEVEAVGSVVGRLRNEARERGWTVAVLTPYQAQREAVRRRIPDTEVSTVDGAQGREWDVVLYSSVRSNPQHRLGFLEDERRLNVAVTRARRHFVLVGDERTLRDNAALAALLDTLEKVRFYYPEPQPRRHEREEWRRGPRQRAPEPRRAEPQPRPEGARGRRRRRGRGRFGLPAEEEFRQPAMPQVPERPASPRPSFQVPGAAAPEAAPLAPARDASPPAPARHAPPRVEAPAAPEPPEPAPEVPSGPPAKARAKRAGTSKPPKATRKKARAGMCEATTKAGAPCANRARPGSTYCARHS